MKIMDYKTNVVVPVFPSEEYVVNANHEQLTALINTMESRNHIWLYGISSDEKRRYDRIKFTKDKIRGDIQSGIIPIEETDENIHDISMVALCMYGTDLALYINRLSNELNIGAAILNTVVEWYGGDLDIGNKISYGILYARDDVNRNNIEE